MTGVSHLKKVELRLEICEDYIFFGESYGQRVLGLSRCLIHRFSDRTISAPHYSKLLKHPFAQNDEVEQSEEPVSSMTMRVCTPPL
jgi:hypothetical protein